MFSPPPSPITGLQGSPRTNLLQSQLPSSLQAQARLRFHPAFPAAVPSFPVAFARENHAKTEETQENTHRPVQANIRALIQRFRGDRPASRQERRKVEAPPWWQQAADKAVATGVICSDLKDGEVEKYEKRGLDLVNDDDDCRDDDNDENDDEIENDDHCKYERKAECEGEREGSAENSTDLRWSIRERFRALMLPEVDVGNRGSGCGDRCQDVKEDESECGKGEEEVVGEHCEGLKPSRKILRSPSPVARRKRVRILWDIENLQIPKATCAFNLSVAICNAITRAAATAWGVQDLEQIATRLFCFYNPGRQNTLTRRARQKLAVACCTLIDVGKDKEGAADNLIFSEMEYIMEEFDHEDHVASRNDVMNAAGVTCFMQGDMDFVSNVKRLVERQFRTVCVFPFATCETNRLRDKSFRLFSWKAMDWSVIVEEANKAQLTSLGGELAEVDSDVSREPGTGDEHMNLAEERLTTESGDLKTADEKLKQQSMVTSEQSSDNSIVDTPEKLEHVDKTNKDLASSPKKKKKATAEKSSKKQQKAPKKSKKQQKSPKKSKKKSSKSTIAEATGIELKGAEQSHASAEKREPKSKNRSMNSAKPATPKQKTAAKKAQSGAKAKPIDGEHEKPETPQKTNQAQKQSAKSKKAAKKAMAQANTNAVIGTKQSEAKTKKSKREKKQSKSVSAEVEDDVIASVVDAETPKRSVSREENLSAESVNSLGYLKFERRERISYNSCLVRRNSEPYDVSGAQPTDWDRRVNSGKVSSEGPDLRGIRVRNNVDMMYGKAENAGVLTQVDSTLSGKSTATNKDVDHGFCNLASVQTQTEETSVHGIDTLSLRTSEDAGSFVDTFQRRLEREISLLQNRQRSVAREMAAARVVREERNNLAYLEAMVVSTVQRAESSIRERSNF